MDTVSVRAQRLAWIYAGLACLCIAVASVLAMGRTAPPPPHTQVWQLYPVR